MNNKDLLGLKVEFVVSDPWEFGSECGTGPYKGIIRDLDQEKVLIVLDKPILNKNIHYFVSICSPRYQYKEIKSILDRENIAINMMLVSTNVVSFSEVGGQTLAVIGNLKKT